MIDLYHLFVLTVFLLWLGSQPADRNALRIVLAATVASWLLVDLVTSHIHGSWKLVIPGAMETVTILAILRWSRNPAGWWQVACLSVAWLSHVLCFADIQLGTDMVYSAYEHVLAVVSIAQVIAFHETYLHHLRRLGRWWTDLGANRVDAVRTPSLPSPVLHNPRSPGA